MARQLSADSGELQLAGAQSLTEHMTVWLTARYLMAIRKLAEKNPDGEPDLKVLREFCHYTVAVRRGNHSGARLKIEQERLERERQETEAEAVEHFKRWAGNSKVREAIAGNVLARQKGGHGCARFSDLNPNWRVAEPVAPDGNGVKPSQTQSNQIRPNQLINQFCEQRLLPPRNHVASD